MHRSFPVRVRGVDTLSQAFEVEALLENLSVSGLYLRLPQSVAPGETLFILVMFPKHGSEERSARRVALRGVVVRVEPGPDGNCGLAIAIRHHRFLSTGKF
jgi:PilZ domain